MAYTLPSGHNLIEEISIYFIYQYGAVETPSSSAGASVRLWNE
jgi:hypothetical protein